MDSYRTSRRDSSTGRRGRAVSMEACEGRQMFATFTVTTNADGGAGSLRDAISKANSNYGADTINFKIGSGHQVIRPYSSLPTLLDVTTVDATTQPGYAGKPLVELTGDIASGYGLNVSGGNSTIKGLTINRFWTGILIYNKGGNTVTNCYIGTGYTGEQWIGNGDKGIIVQTANNKIAGNVISGNGTMGVQLYTGAASNNTLTGNYIGTNAAGNRAVPNGLSGVAVYSGANNVIGGSTAAARNVISGNKQDGVVISNGGATGNRVEGNYIGTDATGMFDVGNGNYGVEISQPYNTVGGTVWGTGNVISGNDYSGVVLWLGSGSNNRVMNNYLGLNAYGSGAVGNSWSGLDISNGSSNNLVQGNTASGNKLDGILVYQGTNNTIQWNIVGFSANKGYGVGNGRDGIRLIETSYDPIIGNYLGNNVGYAVLAVNSGAFPTVQSNTVINDTLFNFKV